MSDKKQLVEFKGECLYAQVYPGQERAPHPDAVGEKPEIADDRTYSIQVECSEELYKKLRKAGISPMQELKDIDGKNYIRIKGTHTKVWVDKKTGEVNKTRFTDPVVTDANGDKLTIDTLIGNGSTVKVVAELVGFPGKSLKALRLKEVCVLELIPYEKTESQGEVVFSEGNGGTVEIVAELKTESFF